MDRCPSDGYPLMKSGEVNPVVYQAPRCMNPQHPIAPSCPECSSTAPHKRMNIGTPPMMKCAKCGNEWHITTQ